MSKFIAERLKMYISYSAAANERSSYSQFVTYLLVKEEHISYEPKGQQVPGMKLFLLT
jgi:hypothetical protein